MNGAAVVGAGLGGLSAAIHLRLQGREVTVFEAEPRVGGRANLLEKEGFRFDTGPSLLNYPWVFRDLFAAAGRRLEDYVELLPVDPSVQFRWPDGTQFSLSGNMRLLLAECERLEEGSSSGLIAFLRDAAAKFDLAFRKLVVTNEGRYFRWLRQLSVNELFRTSIWRSLDGQLRRFFRSRHIREALGSYSMYLGGSPYELNGLFTILPYGELAYGLWLPRGGIYALVSAVEKLARELGVEIRTNCRIARIASRLKQVEGLYTESGELFPASIVISNVDVPTTDRTLLDPPARRPATCRMTPGVLTFYWGVRGLFEESGHHTIFLPERSREAYRDLAQGRLPKELPFYVSIPSATDPALAPAGDTTMFVLVPTPVLSQMKGTDWPSTVEEVKRRVLSRIHLDPDRIAVEEIWTPEEWGRRFGLHDGSAFGAAHTLRQLGPLRPANYSRDLRGLFYVGASTTPGTGMPMVVLGGRMVAERIAAHAC